MPLIDPDAPPGRGRPARYISETASYCPDIVDPTNQPPAEAAYFSQCRRKPGAPTELQSVEQIIADGYLAVPTGDPITALLTDRGHTSRLGLGDVISQVRQRYEIWQQNVLDLDQSRLEAINALHEWESYFGGPGVELRASVHNSLQRCTNRSVTSASASGKTSRVCARSCPKTRNSICPHTESSASWTNRQVNDHERARA